MPNITARDAPLLLHPPLVLAGTAMLIGALVTDVFYSQTFLFQWNNFSIWLITGGLILAALGALGLLADILFARAGPIHWLRFALAASAALLSLVNAFVHSRDSYTAIMPEGMELSGLVTVILLLVIGRGGNIASARIQNQGNPA
jgi:uncharacterized membrane protein